MSDEVVRSTVSVDRYTMPSLFDDIASVPQRYRASRLLVLAAMGLVLEKMQISGATIGPVSSQATSDAMTKPRNEGGIGHGGLDSQPAQAKFVVEELGMGDLLSEFSDAKH